MDRGWDDEVEERRPRRSLLLAAAVVPWVVLAFAVTRSGPGAATTDVTAAPVPAPATGTPARSPTATTPPPSPAPRPDAAAHVLTSGGVASTALPGLTGLALASARDHLGAAAPAVLATTDAPTDRYAEHLVIESLDHPAPGAVVATVAAVLLHRGDAGFERAELVRVAVPFTTGPEGVRLAGTPWRVLGPETTSVEPTGEPVEDADLFVEAGRALAAAGYDEVDVVGLVRLAAWPLLVAADAIAPGDHERRRHQLWLRPHLDSLVLAGTSPDLGLDEEAP